MRLEEAIKQSKFESEMHKLTLNLMYTSQWLEEPVRKLLSKNKLTPPQYNILRILKGSFPPLGDQQQTNKHLIYFPTSGREGEGAGEDREWSISMIIRMIKHL